MDVVGIVVSLAHLVLYRDTYFTDHKHFRERVNDAPLFAARKVDSAVVTFLEISTTGDI